MGTGIECIESILTQFDYEVERGSVTLKEMLADKIVDEFHTLSPWNRFDEWTGIWVEVGPESSPQSACVLFGEDSNADFRILILRGPDSTQRFLQYRSGEWIPEFGLDFATTDGIRVSIVDDQIEAYESCRPGSPPEDLRLDEKQFMFEVFDAINYLVKKIDDDKLPILGETEEDCYHLWKVANTWRAEVKEFPEEQFEKAQALAIPESRVARLAAAKLPQEGVWEAAPFFLPVLRFQGNQELFVQCAAVAERGMGLLGLVTLEAHANPEQEIIEALLGSIEKQKRLPEFVLVKEEKLAEVVMPLLVRLGVHVRIRKRLRDLEMIREEMIEEFPDDEDQVEN